MPMLPAGAAPALACLVGCTLAQLVWGRHREAFMQSVALAGSSGVVVGE